MVKMKDFLGKTGCVVYKKAKDVMMTVKDLMVKMGCVVYNKAKDVMHKMRGFLDDMKSMHWRACYVLQV